ncbi:MAG: putative lipoprotein LppC [Chlamydiae bacterium]|nr:putative lipoprotein LppC [Chlamydiota bacterium]
MKLTSRAFEEGESIPRKYTCQGEGVSPPLEISGVPADAKSLVLLLDDPDVPTFVRKEQMWDHWVVYDIPSSTTRVEEGDKLGTLGKNTSGNNCYEGPCPPDREHRYFFHLYALDTKLGFPEGETKQEVLDAMQGHILAQAELMGRYEKS